MGEMNGDLRKKIDITNGDLRKISVYTSGDLRKISLSYRKCRMEQNSATDTRPESVKALRRESKNRKKKMKQQGAFNVYGSSEKDACINGTSS